MSTKYIAIVDDEIDIVDLLKESLENGRLLWLCFY
jgi:hypothetical protein